MMIWRIMTVTKMQIAWILMTATCAYARLATVEMEPSVKVRNCSVCNEKSTKVQNPQVHTAYLAYYTIAQVWIFDLASHFALFCTCVVFFLTLMCMCCEGYTV